MKKLGINITKHGCLHETETAYVIDQPLFLNSGCLHETEPAYVIDQPLFLNSAVRGVIKLGPHELLGVLKNKPSLTGHDMLILIELEGLSLTESIRPQNLRRIWVVLMDYDMAQRPIDLIGYMVLWEIQDFSGHSYFSGHLCAVLQLYIPVFLTLMLAKTSIETERRSLLQIWKISWTKVKENGVEEESLTCSYTNVPVEESH